MKQFDYESIFYNGPCMMGVVELVDNGFIAHTENKEVSALFGNVDFENRRHHTEMPPDRFELWKRSCLESLILERPVKFQYWKDDKFLSVSVSPLLDREEKNFYTYVIQDLTDFKTEQEKLNQSKDLLKEDLRQKQKEISELEQRSQIIFDYAAAGIAEVDPSGRFLRINKKFCEITGYSIEEMCNLTFQEITHPDDLGVDLDNLKDLYAGKISCYTIDKRYIRKDKSSVWIHLTASLVTRSDGTQFGIAVVQDISDKKALENELHESSKKIEMITQTIPILIWTCNPDGSVNYFNQRWYEYTGQTLEEALGWGWGEIIHPMDLGKIIEAWKHSLSTGEDLNSQHRLRAKDGSYHWFLVQCVALKDSSGKIIQWFGSSANIDDQKKAEKTIENSIKIRDEFLLMASHELKTPVTSIKMHLQMLQSKIEVAAKLNQVSNQIVEFVDIANRQANNLARLMENLLDISRVKLGQMGFYFEEINLSQFLRDVLYRFDTTINRSTCRIKANITPDIYAVVDKLKLEQVVINMLMNSLKYAAGSDITITLERKDGILLKFQDSGPGIPKERRKVVFEKFARGQTHGNVAGFGLGLYISKQIIENHDGTIILEDDWEKTQGTSFLINLPFSSER